jgi:hypothetical protein
MEQQKKETIRKPVVTPKERVSSLFKKWDANITEQEAKRAASEEGSTD